MYPELHVRKILGRTYLNENRLTEALDIFAKILIDYPNDLETLLILGGFYLAGGDGKTAKSIYLHAQQLDPQNKAIERQITMAEELEDECEEVVIPTDIDSISRLLQRLTGQAHAIKEDDIMRAAALLEKIINCPSPADLVSVHLDEIDNLLLALIEVNIRQARADGRKDVAEALHNLQLNINCQRINQDEQKLKLQGDNTPQLQFTGKVLLLLPDPEKRSDRMALLRSSLEGLGCTVFEKENYVPDQDPRPDIIITSNPHTNPTLIHSLTRLSETGIPVIVDLDTNFYDQPVSHMEYASAGLGTQIRSNHYASALSLADLITVPSQVQASQLKEVFDRVLVIPDGWSRQNKLWEKTPSSHTMINIGWVSSSGELEDLLLVRRFIMRIIREFSNTRIVVIGNPHAYRLFDGLPENRRMYIPLVAHEEFPYLLSQLDILVVPLVNKPYNLSLPDKILMQAGARGIPWLASPVPSFQEWMKGGILTESADEDWHLNLRHLVTDHELRAKLGRQGKEAARSREMEHLGKIWLEVIMYLTGVNLPAPQELKQVKRLV
jgi:glycosyltransferase involved in cell wall biosynthesis